MMVRLKTYVKKLGNVEAVLLWGLTPGLIKEPELMNWLKYQIVKSHCALVPGMKQT